MQALVLQNQMLFLRRRDESSGSGMGCFVVLAIIGIVVFLILRGFKDRREQLGASKRAMGSGPVAAQTFANPYGKCPTCGAAGDKMKNQWDGLRKVTWTCNYCGNVAGVQELGDEELPASARQRLGLDLGPGMQGYSQQQDFQQGGMGGMGGGVGGLLTGMMIGNMLGGSGHGHHSDGGWGGSDAAGGDSGGDWGSGGGDDGGSGGDWGDSGGDFGGGDDF